MSRPDDYKYTETHEWIKYSDKKKEATVGITERAAQRILADLVEAGYVQRTRVGRRNHYTINDTATMRHELQEQHQIGGLLGLLRLEPRREVE